MVFSSHITSTLEAISLRFTLFHLLPSLQSAHITLTNQVTITIPMGLLASSCPVCQFPLRTVTAWVFPHQGQVTGFKPLQLLPETYGEKCQLFKWVFNIPHNLIIALIQPSFPISIWLCHAASCLQPFVHRICPPEIPFPSPSHQSKP